MLEILTWVVAVALGGVAVLIIPVRELRYRRRLRAEHDARMRKLFAPTSAHPAAHRVNARS